ncbi:PilZ domain-containing protein [Marinomonas mediterranea]|jgi:hypothetical protein|uniref:Uncharacterized protein n=1 Tax=Marinomonas mediterranea (strain ATCC 700492 / JCM 21426 / NBRC 103028 / MMB-1) TaxID=717774 RepID=F2K3Y7_MARM1|nr:PilZ domain-containing protein [Marinomonas mediterranea]ADZ91329.1 hypothetical protein Marme_2081 [Marinomonas mediterranea MMB-1]WCN09300.1 hypothetical protein GV055_10340 [Marinomonas mediterranea]WCN13382.1 hypothetical protein GV054_10345 [Marinomonas mediterranea]WCN17450.1 hypothetical protein GV053_10475 [Marinomonas mediterranea MMB-1]
MEDTSAIHYESSERRNAVRVEPLGCTLQFSNDGNKFQCVDISVNGVALSLTNDPPTPLPKNGALTAFIVDQDGIVIGKVVARKIYQQNERSGWAFIQAEERVLTFVEELVLETQKAVLRQASSERKKHEEEAILGIIEIDEPTT